MKAIKIPKHLKLAIIILIRRDYLFRNYKPWKFKWRFAYLIMCPPWTFLGVLVVGNYPSKKSGPSGSHPVIASLQSTDSRYALLRVCFLSTDRANFKLGTT